MLPDRVSNPGPLNYESGALPIALRGPALRISISPSQVDNVLLNVRLSYLVVIKITFEFGIYNRV